MSESTATPVAKPAVNPAILAETARCRQIVEEQVAAMKARVLSGTYPSDVCGALGREILTKIEAKP